MVEELLQALLGDRGRAASPSFPSKILQVDEQQDTQDSCREL